MLEALTGLGCILVLAFLRLPMSLAMAVIGFTGYAYMRGLLQSRVVGPSTKAMPWLSGALRVL